MWGNVGLSRTQDRPPPNQAIAVIPPCERAVMTTGLMTTSRRERAQLGTVQVRRGLHVAQPGDEARIAAAVLRLDAVASHETAAAIWGIPTLGHVSSVQLTRQRRSQGTATYEDVVVHHARLGHHEMVVHKGVPVTTPARTVVDLARRRPFRAGVVAADAALRMRHCTREQLRAATEGQGGWPGVAQARKVLAFADARAESPLESISRVAFHHYGLPAPILQATIGGYERADFLWEKFRVIGEADGMGKYTSPEVLRREKEREEDFVRMGFTVFRWIWRDAYRRPDALAHRAEGILKRRGFRP